MPTVMANKHINTKSISIRATVAHRIQKNDE